MRTSLFVITAICLLIPPGSRAQESSSAGLYYHGLKKQRIDLLRDTTRVGLRFRDDATYEDRLGALREATGLDAESAEIELGRLQPGHIGVVQLPEGLDETQAARVVQNLAADPAVDAATPVVYTEPGYEEVLTDQVYVNLPCTIGLRDLTALNDRMGVEILEIEDWSTIGRTACHVRVLAGDARSALDLANAYAAEEVVINATPIFGPLYSPFDSTTPNDTYFNNQWALDKINAPEAWDITTGSSEVIIAIVDSGIDLDHEDLADNILRDGNGDVVGWDPPGGPGDYDEWYDPQCVPVCNYQCTDGHGTNCAGLAAAVGNNGKGISGVSWASKLMPVMWKSLGISRNASYWFVDARDAIKAAADNGADIISCSWHLGQDSGQVENGVKYARELGCVIFGSSGNHNEIPASTAQYPARAEEVIAVGCTDSSDNRWVTTSTFGSNYGAFLDVAAPGHLVRTTDIEGLYGGACDMDKYHSNFAGTSAATPVAAGVAALILSAEPALSPAQVQAVLQFSAADGVNSRLSGSPATAEDTTGRDYYTGYGRVDAEAAVSLAREDRFEVRDPDGKHMASFDEHGNFILEGDLVQEASSAQLEPTSVREFIVRMGNGDEVARIADDNDPTDGDGDTRADMFINGKLYENYPWSISYNVTEPAFFIYDDEGTAVAAITGDEFQAMSLEPVFPYIVPAGSIILSGRAFIGGDPDRASSQGQ